MTAPKTSPRPPGDYSRFLATEEPLLIVGGQAVNLWALYYQEATAELAPFVSRDIDVVGKRETLKQIAQLAGIKPNYFPLKPPSNEVGYIMPKADDQTSILIEVLRWVNGVSEEELEEAAVTFAIGPQKTQVRVPSPIALLKAKLANVISIDQKQRQDVKHVYILWRVIPCYLHDLLVTVKNGKCSQRECVNRLSALLDTVTAEKAKTTLDRLKLEPKALFVNLSAQNLSKIAAFMEKQLPRRINL